MKNTTTYKLLFASFFIFFSFSAADAQLFINEFMASNTGITLDPDYKQSSDWIEIFNNGSSAVDLGGYYLTDNLSKPTKWQIPIGVQIAAKGHLVFWADNMNTGHHTNFALSASGEQIGLSDKSGVLIDSVEFGVQDNSSLYNYGGGSIVVLDTTLLGLPEANVSMGRKPDGSADWVLFLTPTPGAANTTTGYSDIVKSDPGFSPEGGIFHSTISVTINSIFGGIVRYTLDGTEPNAQSPIAVAPISITKNTVVRARIFKPGQIPGLVSTNTYLIDTNNTINKLPVVCLSSAPDNFWAADSGLCVQRSTKPDWEIPVNIELFENDGRQGAAFNKRAGVKVNGYYSWQLPQKMLGVYFRKAYNSTKLDYPWILDKKRTAYDDFALRASGSDWGNTMFRDAMVQTASVENTNIDISGFRPSVAYINGAFAGIYNIREKVDESYINGNYGLQPGTFDMIEEVDTGEYVETGDITANKYFLSLVAKDLSVQSNYDAVAAEMDVEEFTEMVCTEAYSGNNSIGHNLMKWKPKGTGKWRWILMDLDRGFFGASNQLITFYENETGWPFKSLMKNTAYKKQFGRKLADLLFTTFNSKRMVSRIEGHKKAIEADMPAHIARWAGTSGIGTYSSIKAISSMSYWLSEVETLKTFAQARPGILLNDLTNYGFQSPVSVTISTVPAPAGNLTFNGLKIPVDVCSGGYPKGEEIKLIAQPKAGYNFLGWKANTDSLLIVRGSSWKYSDTGVNLGVLWKNSNFDDTAWKSGLAELGYGDGDEKTVISYGTSTSNRYITSYFRKSFVLTNKEKASGLTLTLKYDDGAVIYLNGTELQRCNMPAGTIAYGTLASTAIAVPEESNFHTFSIGSDLLVNGNNIIAVEVHQAAANSADVSFDLELSVTMPGVGNYLSTAKELVLNPQTTVNISAVFEPNGKSILPTEISDVMTLTKSKSPYLVPTDVNIASTGKLIIEPGVELWFSDGVSIYSSASIVAKGTNSEPIIFKSNPESAAKKWGLIHIKNASDTVWFKNVTIENASEGPSPIRDIAALMIENSTVMLDSIYIEHIFKNPLNVYNCQTKITNSRFHSDFAGCDVINIKKGKISMYNCEFVGNKGVDTDALDFGDMSDGNSSVRKSYFHDFEGSNADAVDLGDHAKNVVVDSIIAFNINDKGVSIGQQSSAKITNSVFINCGMGAGMKDSSSVTIDHCTYYGNYFALANYQKHAVDAGSNLFVTNTVLSNSYELGYFNDEYSKIEISNSLDDTENMPVGKNNVFSNPLFTNPTQNEFSFLTGSPLFNAGNDGKNIGANLKLPTLPVSILISDIDYVSDLGLEDLEFIGLYNPGETSFQLDSCTFTSGIKFTFPVGASIGPKEKIYISSLASSTFWNDKGAVVYQWESGHLDDAGEKVQLMNTYGKVIDQVVYNNKAPWPLPINSSEGISLKRYDVDNHFAENWMKRPIADMVGTSIHSTEKVFAVYPNPTNGPVTFRHDMNTSQQLELYNLTGQKVRSQKVGNGETIDLSAFAGQILFARIGNKTIKIVVLK